MNNSLSGSPEDVQPFFTAWARMKKLTIDEQFQEKIKDLTADECRELAKILEDWSESLKQGRMPEPGFSDMLALWNQRN